MASIGPVIPRIIPDRASSDYSVVETLSQEVWTRGILPGRPTSLLSKLGLALHPERFIPYDSTVRQALVRDGLKVRDHDYRHYISAVLSKKPNFVEALKVKNLSARSLNAEDLMSEAVFELRALDKRLMLAGGFNAERMIRDLNP
jgi:hypothetical protein